MKSFNPNRMKTARKRRGLTLKKLGDMIGMTSKSVSDYESGKEDRYPPSNTLSAIAKALDFPEEFFYMDDIASIDETAVSFRSLARMTASVRESAMRAGEIALELTNWIDKKFEMPLAVLPDLRDEKPESAAEAVRNEWGIGQLPIRSMIHLLEAKGVRVFSLVEKTIDMDAFSFWMNETPFIFLNTRKSVERSRFDAAHELGHLILHKHGTPLGKEAESQANRFASAFLMPQGSVRANAPRFPTLNGIIAMKPIWRVSASALLRRLSDLRLITEWQYRSLTIELSKSGGMKDEIEPITQLETSKLLPMVFQSLREEGITKDHIAKELGVYSKEIDTLIFNLTPFSINGGGIKHGNLTDKSHLKVIK